MKIAFSSSYRWIILVTACIGLATAFGERFTFSAFFVTLVEEFSWNRSQAAGAFSLNMIVAGLMAPLVGLLVDRFKPKRVILLGAVLYSSSFLLNSTITQLWQYYLSYGLLGGCGFSFVSTVSHSRILVNWFGARAGTVMGFAFAGGGLGILCLLPLTQFLVLKFSWRMTYQILALSFFHCFSFFLFFCSEIPQ